MLSQTLRSLRPAFAALFGLSFVLNLFVFVSPLYTMQIYDRVLTSRNGTTLVMLSLIVLALFAAYAALEHFRSRALVQLGLCLDRALTEPAFEAAFRGALEARGSQHISPIRDVETLRATLSGSLVPALMDAPWIPIYLGLCFLLHPAIGLVATAGAVAILGVALLNERITKTSLIRAAELGHGASERLAASFRNAEVIKALGMGEAIGGKWRLGHRRALAHHTRAADWGGTLLAATKLLRLTLQCAVLGVGAYLAINQNIAAGVIFAASLIMGRALAPIEGAVGQWKSFVSARSALQRLDATLEAPRGGETMTLPHPAGPLRVEGLSLRAPGAQALLLHNVSFEVEPGEIAAVVGLTGSGKSSLARALVGVWQPTQGVVRLDGNDIRHFSDAQRGRILGYLPQDVELFAGSVRDNITRFDPAATDEAAVAAASAAAAHELVQGFPDGYATQIGDDGATLSGGQRQRIGLARALYGEPALVVLDEPNANLDMDGDAALARALSGLRAAGTIVIVITHRPQILSQVDKIILMQKGQAVRVGLRDEILPVLLQPGTGARIPGSRGPVRQVEPLPAARWARR
ncbi:type I secretion system permease/ATPase [Bosea sp. (in: a-proteobacteria)]|uniref:type I secretion system permease/ATPase n=1 Tax=Bosea sp. (in: a-proteobacteria) TaxID=1871050 RepID=UPI0026254A01|nr:type I secretion system permease/ATPase [Bosea sp. (in: a-proteobacteria)]MCO5090966.1 type I secretion system permease/ATPase [Bosea sp. (in: a-proteobacteria)]